MTLSRFCTDVASDGCCVLEASTLLLGVFETEWRSAGKGSSCACGCFLDGLEDRSPNIIAIHTTEYSTYTWRL